MDYPVAVLEIAPEELVEEVQCRENPPIHQRSTIGQYLMDFGAKFGDNQVKKQTFADLVGANLRGSVSKWFQGLYDPVGIYEIRSRVVLECLGYQFPEHKRMHPDIHTFTRHVGLGLYDYEEAAKMLSVNRDTILRILSGRNNTSNNRIAIVTTYVQNNTDKLSIAVANVLASFSDPTPIQSIETQPIGLDIPPTESIKEVGLDIGQLKDVVAGLVRALGPIAKLLASDVFTADDREEVRTMVGRFAIFDLKNDLIKLCGERARTTITEDK